MDNVTQRGFRIAQQHGRARLRLAQARDDGAKIDDLVRELEKAKAFAFSGRATEDTKHSKR